MVNQSAHILWSFPALQLPLQLWVLQTPELDISDSVRDQQSLLEIHKCAV